ncbi:UNVERIFIED_CONTAM: hypothetical protein RMT77_000657 [Armadillidium vulgare]
MKEMLLLSVVFVITLHTFPVHVESCLTTTENNMKFTELTSYIEAALCCYRNGMGGINKDITIVLDAIAELGLEGKVWYPEFVGNSPGQNFTTEDTHFINEIGCGLCPSLYSNGSYYYAPCDDPKGMFCFLET